VNRRLSFGQTRRYRFRLEKLVKAACNNGIACDFAAGLIAVREREAEGSTFYSEGVAFPHARVAGLDKPLVALGLTRMGISDVATEKPINMFS